MIRLSNPIARLNAELSNSPSPLLDTADFTEFYTGNPLTNMSPQIPKNGGLAASTRRGPALAHGQFKFHCEDLSAKAREIGRIGRRLTGDAGELFRGASQTFHMPILDVTFAADNRAVASAPCSRGPLDGDRVIGHGRVLPELTRSGDQRC